MGALPRFNGPRETAFTEAMSPFVPCETQADIDRLWDGQRRRRPNRRVTAAMMAMAKLDIAALQAAFNGEGGEPGP